MFWVELKLLKTAISLDLSANNTSTVDCSTEMKNFIPLGDNEKTLPTTSAGSKKDLIDDTPYQRNMKLLFCFVGTLRRVIY